MPPDRRQAGVGGRRTLDIAQGLSSAVSYTWQADEGVRADAGRLLRAGPGRTALRDAQRVKGKA